MRGVLSKKIENVENAIVLQQPTPGGATSEPGPEISGRPGRRVKWPWDGAPDYAACNFALIHLFHNLPGQVKVGSRIHAESCLTAIGVVAGFAAQRGLFAQLTQTKDEAVIAQLRTITTGNGARYFVGEPLNRALVPSSNKEADSKLWSLAARGAMASGLPPAQLPKLEDMFTHVSNTVGGEREGMPSLGREHHPALPGKEMLMRVWPLAMMCFSGRFTGVEREYGKATTKFWPAISAHVANALIRKMKPVLNPEPALMIVMESAIYASKLDPELIKSTPAS